MPRATRTPPGTGRGAPTPPPRLCLSAPPPAPPPPPPHPPLVPARPRCPPKRLHLFDVGRHRRLIPPGPPSIQDCPDLRRPTPATYRGDHLELKAHRRLPPLPPSWGGPPEPSSGSHGA